MGNPFDIARSSHASCTPETFGCQIIDRKNCVRARKLILLKNNGAAPIDPDQTIIINDVVTEGVFK